MVVCFRGLRDYGFFCKDGMEVGSGLVLGWNCGINWGLMFLIMGKCWKGGIIKCCFESGVCGENEGRRMVLFARVMRG